MRNLIIFSFMVLLLNSCKKETTDNTNCIKFKEAIEATNIEQTRTAIDNYINNLPSQDYTEQNINNLTHVISNACNITSGIYCFDCVYTLPSQTEIWVSFISGGATIKKTIDISYSADNKMKFVNLHD
jgi:hypothetical protein